MNMKVKVISLTALAAIAAYVCFRFVQKNTLEQTQGIVLSAEAKTKSTLPSCYPSTTNSSPFEQYSVTKNSKKYSYFSASRTSDFSEMNTQDVILIEEDSRKQCKFLNKKDQYISLLAYVPEDVAIALEKHRYSKAISKIGLKAYQKEIDKNKSPHWSEPEFFFPEDVKALKELGVKIPKSAVIVNQVCELNSLNPYIQEERRKSKEYAYKIKSECPPFQKYRELSEYHFSHSNLPLTKIPVYESWMKVNEIQPQTFTEPRISDEKMSYLEKCIRVPNNETLKRFSLVQITSSPSRKVGIRFGYYLAVETTKGNKTNYSLQSMLLNNETCSSSYVSSDIGQHPLAYSPNQSPSTDHSDRDYARSVKLAWFKWRLKHIPGERQSIQGYLNAPSPRLADEEYWTFSQLGFKMPKSYKLVQ